MNKAQRSIEISNGKQLTLWYATTHLTFHWGIESKWHAKQRNENVSQAFYDRGNDGGHYAIMAYQQGQKPSAKAPIWGIYRVEAHPGSLYRPEGCFTMLKGQLTRREAFAQIAEIVKDDPGHIHTYWTDEKAIEWYKSGLTTCLTAHCCHCSECLYNEKVEALIAAGNIQIKPKGVELNLA